MRHAVPLALAVAILAGCSSAPTALLVTERQHTLDGPAALVAPAAPLVRVIPGYAGPAPSVSVVASVPAAEAPADQDAAMAVVAADADAEALDLLADDTAIYGLEGFFSDMGDAIKRTLQRWRLKREVKLALKHRRERAFELHEGAIDTARNDRTAPVTKVNTLAGGLKEIVSSWETSGHGTFAIETRRVVDDEGVTQALTVAQKGTMANGLGLERTRVRTLIGEDGTYKVVTKQTLTYKDDRADYQEWTKTVRADGTEAITGFINHRDGHRTAITGTRDADGKVHVEVSRISPAHNPSPMPIPSASASPA